MDLSSTFRYKKVIHEICNLNWDNLGQDDLVDVAHAYYYFSVQFRGSLEAALSLFPEDRNLRKLQREECNTSNLSPWPGVARPGEAMNHDEFMRRLLQLSSVGDGKRRDLDAKGRSYLEEVGRVDATARALSIASYEDGGLESVFRAILRAPHWHGPLLAAFRHFLAEHIRFDSDLEHGHGALSRHLAPDDRVLPLWSAFKRLLLASAPALGDAAGAEKALSHQH